MDQEKLVSEKVKPSKKATITSLIYIILGCILASIPMFGNRSAFSTYCCILYPIVGLLVMAFSMGQIKFLSNLSRGQSPGIFMGFLFPAFMLFLNSLLDYDILNYKDALIPGVIIVTILFLLLYFTGINYKAEKPLVQGIVMLLCTCIYSFGALTTVNCRFDNSLPVRFNTTVQSKFVSVSKGKNHYMLRLAPWQPTQQTKQIEVNETDYQKTAVNGLIVGHLKSGYLNIRWFYVKL